ncbi:uncharacterized protein [Elaeis guineensis]|uniref:uncharacterized protein n=1 Tax=Elaeis guineensis var. tenera TaxID=51953 RepID=UPI003C6CC982
MEIQIDMKSLASTKKPKSLVSMLVTSQECVGRRSYMNPLYKLSKTLGVQIVSMQFIGITCAWTNHIPCQKPLADKRPSCLEGKRRNATEDSGAPKMSSKESETLYTQWEHQKALHEQLKILRKLQLQTEENGRCLQKFMEDQYKVREAFFHATQSMSMTKGIATEGTSAPFSSDKLLVSLDEDLTKDDMLSDLAKNDVSSDVELVASPSCKRARIDAESSKATISSNNFQL